MTVRIENWQLLLLMYTTSLAQACSPFMAGGGADFSHNIPKGGLPGALEEASGPGPSKFASISRLNTH